MLEFSRVSGSLWTNITRLLIGHQKTERLIQHGQSLFQGTALLRTSYFLFYRVGSESKSSKAGFESCNYRYIKGLFDFPDKF